MSPRAAWRLDQLGFGPVYDYTLGKVDWLAAGLPTVGAGHPAPRVVDALRRYVPTCAPDAAAGPAIEQARAAGWDRCVIVNDHQVVIGVLRVGKVSATERLPAAEVMQTGPSTVRAHEDLDATQQRMREHQVIHLLVTTPEGTLLGVLDAARDGNTADRTESDRTDGDG